jgi:hypothetical protein
LVERCKAPLPRPEFQSDTVPETVGNSPYSVSNRIAACPPRLLSWIMHVLPPWSFLDGASKPETNKTNAATEICFYFITDYSRTK